MAAWEFGNQGLGIWDSEYGNCNCPVIHQLTTQLADNPITCLPNRLTIQNNSFQPGAIENIGDQLLQSRCAQKSNPGITGGSSIDDCFFKMLNTSFNNVRRTANCRLLTDH